MDEQQSINVWTHVEERYQSGQEVQGVVTRVAHFGAFVQLEPELEGIIYTFELGSGPSALASITPGQEIRLYVRNIDARRKRLELSLANAPQTGLMEEGAVPPLLRQKTQSREQSWPLPDPGPDILAIPNLPEPPGCPACQRQIQPTWKFCVYCGGSLQHRCSACGSPQPDLPGARFCHACGKQI